MGFSSMLSFAPARRRSGSYDHDLQPLTAAPTIIDAERGGALTPGEELAVARDRHRVLVAGDDGHGRRGGGREVAQVEARRGGAVMRGRAERGSVAELAARVRAPRAHWWGLGLGLRLGSGQG